MLLALPYVHFREAPHHADFPERVLGFPHNGALQALAYIQMLEVTLFKPPFVDSVFPYRHITPGPLLSHSAAGNSLPSLSFLLQSSAYQVNHPAGKGTFAPLTEVDPISPKQFFAFTELQA